MNCRRCRKLLPENAEFCGFCGLSRPKPAGPWREEKGPNRTLAVLLLIGLGLLILAGLGIGQLVLSGTF